MNKLLKNNLINFIFILYMEFLFRLLMFKSNNIITISSIIIYSLFVSIIITLITSLFKDKINRILRYIIYSLLSILFCLQLIFKKFFKTFFSIYLFSLGDQITEFTGTTIKLIFSNIFFIILFFIPLIIIIIFRKKMNYSFKNKNTIILYVLLALLSLGLYHLCLLPDKGKALSTYDLYYNVNNNELNVQKLGILSSFRLDIHRWIFGFETKVKKIVKEEVEEEKEFKYDYNTLDLKLDDNLNNAVRDYINNTTATKKNEYSGIFKGKNLVFIVAESYDEIAVSQELTPTLYKLTHNGFVFNNFYVPYFLSTIGGEFQALTGLYPNMSILKTWRSGENNFKFGLSNMFKNEGYSTYAYHDHSGYFQDRYQYMKSLGFDNFKACYMGLNINCNSWPESDVEMIENTYNDYINQEQPFLTYYMTVSGHLNYTYSGNHMVQKNWDLVKDLNYSDKAKAYLATQIELDKTLELLISKLEETGKLDDTVIVMVADHYPYGLNLSEINELSSYERDEEFEINHNSLIIWNNKIKTEEVKKVGMPLDVIPTVYNLFGINYDSRLFAGEDLFSTSEGLVILNNGSWITDNGKYSSISNVFTGNKDDSYIQNINNIVQNKINFSINVLQTNAYNFIN